MPTEQDNLGKDLEEIAAMTRKLIAADMGYLNYTVTHESQKRVLKPDPIFVGAKELHTTIDLYIEDVVKAWRRDNYLKERNKENDKRI